MEEKATSLKDCFVHEHGILSYTNYSFSLFLFIQRLYKELDKERIGTVFFLAREGEYLKKLFDFYCRRVDGSEKITSRYLYVSRQSTFPASLTASLDDEDFSRLFRQYNELSVKAFLKNIGFSASETNLLQDRLKIDFDKVIPNFKDSPAFAQLRSLPLFSEQYSKRIQTEKNALVRYLEEQGFFSHDTVAIVDVGWKGSIQDNISLAIGSQNTIKGYYLGLVGDVSTSIRSQKKGILFADYPLKTQYFNIWNYDSHFFERLLTASHPSTRGYVPQNGNMVPVFNSHGKEKKNYELMKPLQDAIFQKFQDISECWNQDSLTEEEKLRLVMRYHICAMTEVNSENMQFQFLLLRGQEENFGQQTSNEQLMSNKFSVPYILKILRKKYRMLKNPEVIARFLCSKGMYSPAAAIVRISGKKLLKDLKNS